MTGPYEVAVFGGGCFWCTEAVFKMLRGVVSVMPGYSGGTKENPTYEEVSLGNTGHAEVIKIEFDPAFVSYHDLLTVFFASHDPTTLNRQGNDVGTQYRSVVFYTTPDQKRETEEFIEELEKSSKEGGPIVTEVVPFKAFYFADAYHQNYFVRHKDDPYCQIVINPKVEKVQKEFSKLLNNKEKSIKVTEAPFTGKYLHEHKSGMYTCAACGNPLFSSDTKFDSGTGWPSFDTALPGAVKFQSDMSNGMERTEVVCARCGSHLGHIFDDGPTRTGKRYCVNSVCLDLKENEK